ncbi:MAG: acylphosphatase [Candidatus Omnitrophota bacterium]
MKRLHAIFRGRVQGVGFRFTVEHIAEGLGICGWVRNSRDGSVEIIAEAEETELKAMIEQIEDSFSSYIREKEIAWDAASGEFSDFRVKF